jgi:hypothetical protein
MHRLSGRTPVGHNPQYRPSQNSCVSLTETHTPKRF